MPVEIEWINHASFRIAAGGNIIYIDPWKLPPEMSGHDADVVFISHTHYDHYSEVDIEKVSKAGTAVVGPAETAEKLAAAKAITPGERMTIKEITIEAVAAYNIDKAFHPKGNNWLGAVITIGGKRIYYAGDTDLIPEMSGLKDIDLALLPVGGTYTLDASQAAEACRTIGPKAALPYHWGDIVGSPDDAERFGSEVTCCEVHILQPGGSVTL